MTKKEAIHFLYQIADEIRSFLDKTSSPKGQWTSHKRLEALSMAISALYDLFQAEEDGRLLLYGQSGTLASARWAKQITLPSSSTD